VTTAWALADEHDGQLRRQRNANLVADSDAALFHQGHRTFRPSFSVEQRQHRRQKRRGVPRNRGRREAVLICAATRSVLSVAATPASTSPERRGEALAKRLFKSEKL